MKTQTWVRNLAGVIDSRATKETDTVENILLLGLFRRVFLYARINMALCAMIAILPFGADTCRAAEIQKAFESPDAAFKALLDGFNKNSDEAILGILGQDQRDLVVQADKEEAADIRHKVYNCAQEHLQIVTNGDKATARLGIKDWPFPIPMVKHTDGWVFDTAAGKEEILNRRIGRNELHAIHLLDACHDAQRVYAEKDRTGNKVLKYAQKLISTRPAAEIMTPQVISNGKCLPGISGAACGRQDGLYWPVEAGSSEEISPLAAAFEDGQEFRDGQNVPYFGYYFKVLTKQGEKTTGGKYDYVINGNMIAGFAFVAWPADYRASGVMTFCISHQGTLYQKDLGPDTARIAIAMDEYNPDNTWREVKPEEK